MGELHLPRRYAVKLKKVLATTAFTLGTGVSFAASAGAQGPPVDQQGLVNVNAQDTTVQVPVAVAANICGVDVNVLASNVADSPVTCDTQAVSIAEDPDNGPGGPVSQDGLVNVNLTDTTVQVPVGVAANVCGVDANVLAQEIGDAPVNCDADADAGANG
jgi:hypothetical protein